MRALALGGNQPVFNLLKEYDIADHPIFSKYSHASMRWYRKKLVSSMDGIPFDLSSNTMPPKDMDERIEQTKIKIKNAAEVAKQKLIIAGGHIKTGAGPAKEQAKENVNDLVTKVKSK